MRDSMGTSRKLKSISEKHTRSHQEISRPCGNSRRRWAGGNPQKGEPRYKLPPRFRKTLILYNLHRVVDAKRLVIVEGYWSVFRLHALGVPTVALMGRTLSAVQENLLVSSGARLLTLLLDGDNPGREATAQLLPRLSRNFFVHAPTLPEGAEPDTVSEGILMTALSV